jgi:hypothetical protein
VKRVPMFGTCCDDLRVAVSEVPRSFFRTEENGVFYLAVGYMPTQDGPAFFDQAVLFCPFCGVALQTKEEIAARAASTDSR